jgi:transcriptional regulator with XRE-family HTH domain
MQALNYHNLCVSHFLRAAHTVTMDSQEKNGGPNFLRQWRAFRGLTQQQLASGIGTNANMVQYLESGERGLSAKWLRKLAPVLDTTPGMILDHDPHELDSDIIDIWATASTRERRQLADVARAIVKDGTNK